MRTRGLQLVQAIGTVTIFLLVAISGLAAGALVMMPASPLAWYVDREIFGVLRFARMLSVPFAPAMGPVALFIGLGGVALAFAAYRKSLQFVAGLLSHTCFVLIAQPAFAMCLAAPDARTASLILVDVAPQTYVVTWLSIVATILTMAACHLTYLIGFYRARGKA